MRAITTQPTRAADNVLFSHKGDTGIRLPYSDVLDDKVFYWEAKYGAATHKYPFQGYD